ncbi:unnamed protein product [Orchesella dallaii]|uniref:Glycogenin-1 n=1 Tax=Orchesella dallaii TaxID=48710 RepID=A0ABP1RHF4_9HEXA
MITAQSCRAWVTYVSNDEKIITKALVLARSLKRVCSVNNTVVFTRNSLSEELTEKVMQTFDLVIPLPSSSSYKLPIDEEALVHALALKNFEKCVFLRPDCMVLRNCDEVFEKFACVGIINDDNYEKSFGAIGFIPCFANSKSLKQFLLAARNGIEKECEGRLSSLCLWRTWLRNNVKDLQYLDRKYNIILDLKNGAIKW